MGIGVVRGITLDKMARDGTRSRLMLVARGEDSPWLSELCGGLNVG